MKSKTNSNSSAFTPLDLRRGYASYIAEMAEADARRLAPRCNAPTARELELAAHRASVRDEEDAHWKKTVLPRLGTGYRAEHYMEGEVLRWRARGSSEWHLPPKTPGKRGE